MTRPRFCPAKRADGKCTTLNVFNICSSYLSQAFTRDVGEGILPSWEPIVAEHRGRTFTEQQRNWQVGTHAACMG